jgi:hypothetical protein
MAIEIEELDEIHGAAPAQQGPEGTIAGIKRNMAP